MANGVRAVMVLAYLPVVASQLPGAATPAPVCPTDPGPCPYSPSADAMMILDDSKRTELDPDVVLCRCQGQGFEFARRASNIAHADFATEVRIAKVGRVAPPPYEPPPCVAEAASWDCGEEARCYFDTRCGNLSGVVEFESAMKGCNAGGYPLCRFCGTEPHLPCPEVFHKVQPEQYESIESEAIVLPYDANSQGEGDLLVQWDYEVYAIRQSCGDSGPTSERWKDNLNRRITWRGASNRVSILGNTQYVVEFMDHEGTGFYLAEDANVCDANGRGLTHPDKNCIFAHSAPGDNWYVHNGERMGSPGNGAVNVETYELPFEAWRNDTHLRFSLVSALNHSCHADAATDGTHHAYHGGRFPTIRLATELRVDLFSAYKETFEVEDFDYHGNVSDPKHSLAFLFFLDTERISFTGGSRSHNPFTQGPSFSLPDDLDCNALPLPRGCPYLLLDDEVMISWDLSLDGYGGPLIAGAAERLPLRASVPEGRDNPAANLGRPCESPCPANSTGNFSAALEFSLLYCNRSQLCGARYAYFSFHPRGAQRLVWDPTSFGRSMTSARKAHVISQGIALISAVTASGLLLVCLCVCHCILSRRRRKAGRSRKGSVLESSLSKCTAPCHPSEVTHVSSTEAFASVVAMVVITAIGVGIVIGVPEAHVDDGPGQGATGDGTATVGSTEIAGIDGASCSTDDDCSIVQQCIRQTCVCVPDQPLAGELCFQMSNNYVVLVVRLLSVFLYCGAVLFSSVVAHRLAWLSPSTSDACCAWLRSISVVSVLLLGLGAMLGLLAVLAMGIFAVSLGLLNDTELAVSRVQHFGSVPIILLSVSAIVLGAGNLMLGAMWLERLMASVRFEKYHESLRCTRRCVMIWLGLHLTLTSLTLVGQFVHRSVGYNAVVIVIGAMNAIIALVYVSCSVLLSRIIPKYREAGSSRSAEFVRDMLAIQTTASRTACLLFLSSALSSFVLASWWSNSLVLYVAALNGGHIAAALASIVSTSYISARVDGVHEKAREIERQAAAMRASCEGDARGSMASRSGSVTSRASTVADARGSMDPSLQVVASVRDADGEDVSVVRVAIGGRSSCRLMRRSTAASLAQIHEDEPMQMATSASGQPTDMQKRGPSPDRKSVRRSVRINVPPSGRNSLPPSGRNSLPPSGRYSLPPSGRDSLPSSGRTSRGSTRMSRLSRLSVQQPRLSLPPSGRTSLPPSGRTSLGSTRLSRLSRLSLPPVVREREDSVVQVVSRAEVGEAAQTGNSQADGFFVRTSERSGVFISEGAWMAQRRPGSVRKPGQQISIDELLLREEGRMEDVVGLMLRPTLSTDLGAPPTPSAAPAPADAYGSIDVAGATSACASPSEYVDAI